MSIADGVFFVTNLGGFNTMFVEFADFVLAVEAPAAYPWLETVPPANMAPSASLGEQYLDAIQNTVPEKPVRYLALTHHHSDHIGGARPFMVEGAALLTTPGNRDFIHRMAEAIAVREPLVETLEGKKVVSDGRRRVELINIGSNPHTEEMIVVWIPEEGILFQGDLFYPIPLDYFPPTGRTIIMRHFAEWLRENQISPKRIYGVHGPWYGTEEHLNKILAESEQPPEEDFLIKLTNIEF
jgi:glyoxylase-like metal-dependent hydrolase (beta-lactamase superfamily II)